MKNTSITRWGLYALTGLVVLFFIPGQYRGWLIAALFLGGGVYIAKNGGLQKFEDQFKPLTGGGTDNGNQ